MEYDMVIDFKGTGRFRERLSQLGYSDIAISYCMDRPNLGTISDADIIADNTGSCDDTMTLYLKMDQDLISDAKVDITGCAGTISSAMALVDLVRGKTIDQADAIEPSDFMERLEPFPEEKTKCIYKAIKTLKKAVKIYREKSEDRGQRSEDSRL